MRTTRPTLTIAALALLAGSTLACPPAAAGLKPTTETVVATEPIAPHDRPVIQLALLLDTSNSMDGLIDQAKAALWAVVNELGEAQFEGETPQLQVALIEYGNNSITTPGWVRMRTNFTTDLDLLSEQLFGLTTNGGEEHCGQALAVASWELRWWRDAARLYSGVPPMGQTLREAAMENLRKALAEGHPRSGVVGGPVTKIIVIAGNEPFTQGPEIATEMISRLRSDEVIVNTVFCGPRATGSSTGWEAGARAGGGLYASIDSDHRIVEPPTPYDARLGELNRELNSTYLPYGARGAALADRQVAQDELNATAGQAPARYAAKASSNYTQAGWDLVDAIDQEQIKLDDLDEDALPESLRGLPREDQAARIDEARERRAQIRQAILDLSKQRAAFIENWRKEQAEAPKTFDRVLVEAVREQATQTGMTFAD